MFFFLKKICFDIFLIISFLFVFVFVCFWLVFVFFVCLCFYVFFVFCLFLFFFRCFYCLLTLSVFFDLSQFFVQTVSFFFEYVIHKLPLPKLPLPMNKLPKKKRLSRNLIVICSQFPWSSLLRCRNQVAADDGSRLLLLGILKYTCETLWIFW